MSKLFISHSARDHARARELQQALARFEVMAWTERYALGAGNRIAPLIRKAMTAASAFAVLVSPSALDSGRVRAELKHAIAVHNARGENGYPIVLLLLEGAEPPVLDAYSGEKPTPIAWQGKDADMVAKDILAAMAPAAAAVPSPQPQATPEPLEDLTLHLTDLEADEDDGACGTGARALLSELMAEMEQRIWAGRAVAGDSSVESSLHRLSPASRDKANVLSLFYGGVSLVVLHRMMSWELAELDALADELAAVGLGVRNSYRYVSLHPGLRPYLQAHLPRSENDDLEARWLAAMRGQVDFLVQLRGQHGKAAKKLTVLDLPNLFALLARVQDTGDAAAAVDLTGALQSLLQPLGRPRLFECVTQARDSALRVANPQPGTPVR